MTKLPDAVRIGYKTVKIAGVDGLLTKGDRVAQYRDGRDGQDPAIEYESYLRGKELAVCLLHEINHGLCEMHIPAGTVTGMPHDAGLIEEVYVDALATGLVCFLLDNPDFAHWLWETLDD